MTTIIERRDSSGGWGLVIGIVVAILLIALFFLYGLPAIRDSQNPGSTNVNVNIPNPIGGNNSGQ